MNYRELITQLTPQRGVGEARAIVRMVMEERFGLSQMDLLLGKDTTLSADDRKDFEKIAVRLLRGEPVQHVLGFADFCGHRFRVNNDVLIPRPETEELVRRAIAALADADSAKKGRKHTAILDLCTGSGCIATSLALAFPQARVVGVDISAQALAVARANAARLGASNAEFLQQDILCCSEADSAFPSSPFAVITANPPYVRACESSEMEPTVLDFEPHLALFVPDDDPLLFYRAIASIARGQLLPAGRLFAEINAALCEETRQLFLSSGFGDVCVLHDQFGRPRILSAAFQESI